MSSARSGSSTSAFRRAGGLLYRGIMRWLPDTRAGDRLAALIRFVRLHGRLPTRATSYNDILYRIKTTDDILDPLRIFVSDKEFLKLYVKAVVGEEYNVRTLGVVRRREDVESYEFPPDCCIKPTHASGHVILRRDNALLDRDEIRSWFDLNHYYVGREANYRLLQPKIIIEPLIFEGADLEDYKIFCMNGAPRMIQVDLDRHIAHSRRYYDADWNELDFSIKYPRATRSVPRPENLAHMLEVAAALSKQFWFTRVDLYSNGRTLLVGELTHVPDNAGGRFIPPEAETAASERVFGKQPSFSRSATRLDAMSQVRSSC